MDLSLMGSVDLVPPVVLRFHLQKDWQVEDLFAVQAEKVGHLLRPHHRRSFRLLTLG